MRSLTRRGRAAAAAPGLPLTALPWLLAALALALLPHLSRLPWWLGAMYLASAGWRWRIGRDPSRLPGGWLLAALTLAAVAGLVASYGTLLGKQVGVALLAAMAALKLLEARRSRDALVLVFLGFFLLLSQLLYSQTLFDVVYVAVTVLLLLTAQTLSLPQHARLAPRRALRLSAVTLAQALPLMALLFLLFPRIPGPLWGLPNDASSGMTGLSDRMTPGLISELIQSPEVAFRVRFDDAAPPANALYWRGPTLWWYRDRTWQGRIERPRRQLPYQPLGEPFGYEVTMEPHGRRLLFALDLPYAIPDAAAGITATYQLQRKRPVLNRLRYRASSTLQYRSETLDAADRRRYLQLPARGNPQTRLLASRWRDAADSDADVVRLALQTYRQQPFYYTLTPPLLPETDSIDRFLFDSRQGFCEHYAGSFVFAMRAAGVPARVVTGYQGGEANGDYLLVRQSDAHAWAEVWLHGRGWSRVDPTAAVAPERIERGLFAAIDDPERLPLLARGDGSLLRRLALGWDGVNNAWNDWVLGYDRERQRSLLETFSGFDNVGARELMLTLVGALALAALTAAAWLGWRRRRRDRADPLARTYLRFCGKLARVGLPRRADEGPVAFAERVARARPDLAEPVRRIAQLYAAQRYARGAATPPRPLRSLRRLVRAFNPTRYRISGSES